MPLNFIYRILFFTLVYLIYSYCILIWQNERFFYFVFTLFFFGYCSCCHHYFSFGIGEWQLIRFTGFSGWFSEDPSLGNGVCQLKQIASIDGNNDSSTFLPLSTHTFDRIVFIFFILFIYLLFWTFSFTLLLLLLQ